MRGAHCVFMKWSMTLAPLSLIALASTAMAEDVVCPSDFSPEHCEQYKAARANSARQKEEEAAALMAAQKRREADDQKYKDRAAAADQAEVEYEAMASQSDNQLRAWSILYCVSVADRKEATAVISRERVFSKKAGVVNLALLEEQKQILKAADYDESRAKAAMKKAKGKPLPCTADAVETYRSCRGSRLPMGAAFDDDEESCLHRDNLLIVNVVERVTAE